MPDVWTFLLSQVGEITGWEKIAGLSGAAAWAVIAYLFITNKLCTQATADKRLEEWKCLFREQGERLERAEQRLLDSLSMAKHSTEIAEKVVEKVIKKGQ